MVEDYVNEVIKLLIMGRIFRPDSRGKTSINLLESQPSASRIQEFAQQLIDLSLPEESNLELGESDEEHQRGVTDLESEDEENFYSDAPRVEKVHSSPGISNLLEDEYPNPFRLTEIHEAESGSKNGSLNGRCSNSENTLSNISKGSQGQEDKSNSGGNEDNLKFQNGSEEHADPLPYGKFRLLQYPVLIAPVSVGSETNFILVQLPQFTEIPCDSTCKEGNEPYDASDIANELQKAIPTIINSAKKDLKTIKFKISNQHNTCSETGKCKKKTSDNDFQNDVSKFDDRKRKTAECKGQQTSLETNLSYTIIKNKGSNLSGKTSKKHSLKSIIKKQSSFEKSNEESCSSGTTVGKATFYNAPKYNHFINLDSNTPEVLSKGGNNSLGNPVNLKLKSKSERLEQKFGEDSDSSKIFEIEIRNAIDAIFEKIEAAMLSTLVKECKNPGTSSLKDCENSQNIGEKWLRSDYLDSFDTFQKGGENNSFEADLSETLLENKDDTSDLEELSDDDDDDDDDYDGNAGLSFDTFEAENNSASEIPEFNAVRSDVMHLAETRNELGGYMENNDEDAGRWDEPSGSASVELNKPKPLPESSGTSRRKRDHRKIYSTIFEDVKAALGIEERLEAQRTLEKSLTYTENIFSKIEGILKRDKNAVTFSIPNMPTSVEHSNIKRLMNETKCPTSHCNKSVSQIAQADSSCSLFFLNSSVMSNIQAGANSAPVLEVIWPVLSPLSSRAICFYYRKEVQNISQVVKITVEHVSTMTCTLDEEQECRLLRESTCPLTHESLPKKKILETVNPLNPVNHISAPLCNKALDPVNISYEFFTNGQESEKSNFVVVFPRNEQGRKMNDISQSLERISSENSMKFDIRCSGHRNKIMETFSNDPENLPERRKIQDMLLRTYKIQHKLERFCQNTNGIKTLTLPVELIPAENRKMGSTGSVFDLNVSSESDVHPFPLIPKNSLDAIKKDSTLLLRNMKQKSNTVDPTWNQKHVKFDATGPVVFRYKGSQNSGLNMGEENGNVKNSLESVEAGRDQLSVHRTRSLASLKPENEGVEANPIDRNMDLGMRLTEIISNGLKNILKSSLFSDLKEFMEEAGFVHTLDEGESNVCSSVSSFKSSNDLSDYSDSSLSNPSFLVKQTHSKGSKQLSLLNKLFHELESFRRGITKRGKQPVDALLDSKCELSIESPFGKDIAPEGHKNKETDEKTEVSKECVIDQFGQGKVLKTTFKGKESTTELLIDLKDLTVSGINDISVEKQKLSADHTKISIILTKPNCKDFNASGIYARRCDTIIESGDDGHSCPSYYYHNQTYENSNASVDKYLTKDDFSEEQSSKVSQQSDCLGDDDEDFEDFKSVASSVSSTNVEVVADSQKVTPPKKRCKYTTDCMAKELNRMRFSKHRFEFYNKTNDGPCRNDRNLFETELKPLKKAFTDMQVRVENYQRHSYDSGGKYFERALKLAKMSGGYCQKCGNRSVIPEDPSGYYQNLLRSHQSPKYNFRTTSATNSSFYSVHSSNTDMSDKFGDLNSCPSFLSNEFRPGTRNSSNAVFKTRL